MPRSLKVRRDCIATVKAAVYRSGFSSQRRLAEQLEMALSTVNNFLTGKPVDVAVFEEICRRLSLETSQIADSEGLLVSAEQPAPSKSTTPQPERVSSQQQDWGEAPDVSVFYDRVGELETLTNWVKQGCRLVVILGMGGMGKTALSTKLAQQVQPEFTAIIWRSLRNAPPVLELLADWIRFLSNQQEVDLSDDVNACILRLVHYLRQQRCLLILDNAESVLQAGDRTGQYRTGYEGYGQILRAIGDTPHQSCLLLTSREKPKGLAYREGQDSPVRSLQLSGLTVTAGKALIKHQGMLTGSEPEWQMLVQHYAGNPLALKMAAAGIEDFFASEISRFLDYASQGSLVFENIRDLLKRQVSRLSELELEVMYWLAINREPTPVGELQQDLRLTFGLSELLAALSSLQHRSLIESSAGGFTQQPVVMEFMTEELLRTICPDMIQSPTSDLLAESWLRRCALVKATAKDYVRDSQIRLILEPLITLAIEQLGTVQALETNLRQWLEQFHQSSIPARYAVGNLLHLLHQLNADLTGLNLSGLQIWQANLANLMLNQVNLAQAQIAQSTFAERFGSILSVAFSPDGRWLAAGESNGSIQIWEVASGRKRMTLQDHTSWVWSILFAPDPRNPDQQILVSAGDDHQIRLWDLQQGQCWRTLSGHQRSVTTLGLSPDGHWIASGSQDGTIGLWNLQQPNQSPRSLAGHCQRVWSVIFSPDGRTLASAGEDHAVKLWDLSSGECYETFAKDPANNAVVAFSPDGRLLVSTGSEHTICIRQIEFRLPSHTSSPVWLKQLRGHTNNITAFQFSSDGHYLVSSSYDHTVKVWDVMTGKCLKTLKGHTSRLWSVAFSPTDRLVASGGDDNAVRLWDPQTGQCTKTLQGYTNAVLSLALSHDPANSHLVSGHEDGTIRIWNLQTGEILKTLHSHCDRVWSVKFLPHTMLQFLNLSEAADLQDIVLSSSADRTIKLWNWKQGKCLRTLHGHTSWVWSVVCSPCGRYLASSSYDRTVKLWDLKTGDCTDLWKGQRSEVSVTFSPDGQYLASSGYDSCIKLWNIKTRQLIGQMADHSNTVWQVAFSADGQQLASASHDQTLRLWDVASGQCLQVFTGHTNPVLTVAFSENGQLVSSGFDQTVRVWDLQTGHCLRVMQEHTSHISALTLSGSTIFSGSFDETIKLWHIDTGECLNTFRAPRPYEKMNIANISGLTEAEKENLKCLGAIEA